ncbi:MAG: hypothetical protein H0U76_04085 [Ktedonobacteraceae bacterium]|nr:hypothetical protein [Ktedonobacteraceae bacterium]
MKTYTFSQCIELLDIDAKVFRRWVREDLNLGEKDQVSRADSRVRYLTREQLERLAEQHDKVLPADDQTASEDDHSPPGAYKLLVDRMEALEKSTETLRKAVSSFTGDITFFESQTSHLQDTFGTFQTGVSTRLDALEQSFVDVDARLQKVSVPEIPPEQQIAEIEARYQQRIAELEAQLAIYQQPKKPAPPPSKKRPARKKKRSPIKTLPVNLVARNAFSALHHVSEKLVSKASIDGKIATTEGKWLSGGYVVTRALNEKGKHDFYQVFSQRPDFTRCDQCPHELS